MKKNKNFKQIITNLRGLFSIGISDMVGGGISSLFWLYMASILEVESYGEISYLLAIGNVATTIALIGSKNTMMVYVPKKIKLQSSLFIIVIVLGVITAISSSMIFSNLELSIYIFGGIIFGLGISEILAHRNYSSYPKYLIIQKILMVIFAIGLYHWIGVEGIILGIALSFFTYLPVIFNTFRNVPLNSSLLKPRFGFIVNSYGTSLAATFSSQIDKLITAPLLGFVLLGNYQLGIQFIAAFQLLPHIILKYTLPHDANGVPNKKLKILSVIISFCSTILIILLAPIVVPLFFQKFLHVIEIIQILSISLIPYSVSSIYTSKFFGKENAKIILSGMVLLVISLVIGIFTLGNIMGIFGVSISYVISITIQAIFYIIVDLKIKTPRT